jgi:hypothetical protein
MCKLSPATGDPVADFTGKVGDQVQIDVSGTSGRATIQQGTSYADQPLAAPWQFTIKAGNQVLSVLVADPVVNDTVVIEEVCDPHAKNALLSYEFHPNAPLARLIILGQP